MQTVSRNAATQPLPRPMQVLVTAGGLLWRRRKDGTIEVCLLSTPDRKRWMVPRGRVHEDERLEDAAVRAVHDLTGYLGKPGRQLARAASESGEIAYLFLLPCSHDDHFVNAARKITASWVSLDRAMDVLEEPGERATIRRAAQALAEPIDATLPFFEELAAAAR